MFSTLSLSPPRGQDAEMWRSNGDKLYQARDWKAAADAYSESLKRDGCFVTCVANRAACHVHVGETSRCAADCDLAIAELEKKIEPEHPERIALVRLYTLCSAAFMLKDECGAALQAFIKALEIDHVDVGASCQRSLEAIFRDRAAQMQSGALADRPGELWPPLPGRTVLVQGSKVSVGEVLSNPALMYLLTHPGSQGRFCKGHPPHLYASQCKNIHRKSRREGKSSKQQPRVAASSGQRVLVDGEEHAVSGLVMNPALTYLLAHPHASGRFCFGHPAHIIPSRCKNIHRKNE